MFVLSVSGLHIHVIKAKALKQYSVLLSNGKSECILDKVLVLFGGKERFNCALNNIISFGHVAGQSFGIFRSRVGILLLVQARKEDLCKVIQLAQQFVNWLSLDWLILLVNFD